MSDGLFADLHTHHDRELTRVDRPKDSGAGTETYVSEQVLQPVEGLTGHSPILDELTADDKGG
jgi:hypothetical protein